MRSNIIIQSRSIEAVYNEVMEYLMAKYFTPPEHVIDPAYGASAEAWYEAGGDFYEAEARLEDMALKMMVERGIDESEARKYIERRSRRDSHSYSPRAVGCFRVLFWTACLPALAWARVVVDSDALVAVVGFFFLTVVVVYALHRGNQ